MTQATAIPRVVCIGEVLWDLLPSGPRLGGAPCNVACHAASLGIHAAMISAVGADALGRHALDSLRSRDIDVRAVASLPDTSTGTVHVAVDAHGHPTFDIVRDVAWDRIDASDAALAAVASADAVCFGTLAQRTPGARLAINRLLASTRPGALRVCDINLRPPFHGPDVIEDSLRRCSVLKLNEDELAVLAARFGLEGTPCEQVARIASAFGLAAVALTMGRDGAGLWLDGQWLSRPAPSIDVIDSVGAGDAFTATLIRGLLGAWSPDFLLERAIEVAAFVCTQHGATPRLPDPLRTGPKKSGEKR